MMTIDELNNNYGIADRLQFVSGKGGLPCIGIRNQSANSIISLHGAQVLSFKPLTERSDMLFLSPNAIYEDGKAIRGGIPICWPWFGPDPERMQRPNHGFVRNYPWSVRSTTATDTETMVSLQFLESDNKGNKWNFPFALSLEITVGQQLNLSLTTRNTGTVAMSVTQAFHSYFQVGDVTQVEVKGLEDAEYYDQLEQHRRKKQAGVIVFDEEIDRIYTGVKRVQLIKDSVLKRQIEISSLGNENVVVWNPWIKKTEKTPDLQNQAYKAFVCVETGNVADNFITVLPGYEHCLATTYQILRD